MTDIKEGKEGPKWLLLWNELVSEARKRTETGKKEN
jgi:hypothetical protein